MWFLRYYASEGDVPGMIQEFDLALRTSSENWSQFFALLISASKEPSIARELSKRLSRQPKWGPQFLAQLVESTTDLPTAVAIAKGHLNPKDPLEQPIVANLIERLANGGYPNLAWQEYSEVSRATSAAVRGGDFEHIGPYPPIDWQLADQPDLSAYRQSSSSSSGGNALFMAASNGRSGDVARQLLHLAPGRYRFTAKAGDLPVDPLDRPAIRVSCIQPSATRDLFELRPLGRSGGIVQLKEAFSIPSGCDWQWLTISLSGEGPSSDASMWIDDVAIYPAK
jgi:hypothetical protein